MGKMISRTDPVILTRFLTNCPTALGKSSEAKIMDYLSLGESHCEYLLSLEISDCGLGFMNLIHWA